MNLTSLEQRLLEAYDELWDTFVDPREPFFDDGDSWRALSSSSFNSRGYTSAANSAPLDESQLTDIRNQCRQLALENEFAINGHENRISYIVGAGHTYRATPRKLSSRSVSAEFGVRSAESQAHITPHSTLRTPNLSASVQAELDHFILANHWHRRQQEIVRRRDRDGEAFLRFFTASDGTLRVRFIEPDQIATPPDQAVNFAARLDNSASRLDSSAARLGVLTDRQDFETVLGYFVDGQLIDGAEIQHRKANVDGNVRRGLPLFYPVRKNLRRAEKLLRNMSVVAEIQSAIALIRKHKSGTASGVQQFVSSSADVTLPSPGSTSGAANQSRTSSFRRYGPGTIIDAPAGLEYDFPAAGLDASNFVTVLQAELRAVASRLVMPEFMLTSDASNANYSSTLVAEGPAMRMFTRLQAEQVCDDLHVMWRVVDAAIHAGRLPPEARTLVEIQAVPPSLLVRDQLKEAQRLKIENASGILSRQTWSQRTGLDYDQEQANFAADAQKANANAQ